MPRERRKHWLLLESVTQEIAIALLDLSQSNNSKIAMSPIMVIDRKGRLAYYPA
jgi:hypothetical protein